MDVSRRHLMGLAATAAASIGSVALFGCEEDETEAPPPPPPPSSTYPRSDVSPGAAKQTKEEAEYQDTPNGSQHCGACANFVAPDDCRIVRGPVSPDGWCRNFRARG